MMFRCQFQTRQADVMGARLPASERGLVAAPLQNLGGW